MTEHTINQAEAIAVAESYYLNPDMSTCPVNVKVQLMNPGGVLVYGTFDGRNKAWQAGAPLPRRRQYDNNRMEGV